MFATRKFLFRSICWLMAVVTPLSPSAVVYAQAPATQSATAKGAPTAGRPDTGPTRFVLPYSSAIASLRPRQLLTCETAKMLPVEIVQAACLKELGFDPLLVEQVLVSAIPSLAGPPSYAASIELTEKIDLSQLSMKLVAHTAPGTRDGQTYLQSQDPQLPSFFWVADTTLLVAPDHVLNQLLSAKPRQPDAFASSWTACAQDDFALLVNIGGLRPLIQLGLSQVAANVPDEFKQFLELPNHLERARLRVSFSGAGPVELSLAAKDATAANRVEELIDEGMSIYRKQAALQASKLQQSEDPVEQATGRYIMRTMPAWSEQLTPTRNEDRFTLFEIPAEQNTLGGPASIAVMGVLVALLLPAVQAAREAARRNSSMNNMKHLMLSLHIYNDLKKKFPAHASYSPDGKPLLSWRVHILPYMEREELYNQFHLDEPWNSEHNRQFIPLMPEIFLDPSSGLSSTQGRTHYLGIQGKGMAFDGTEKGKSFASFRDGSSNTIMLVQTNDERAAIWTKPEDLEWTDAVPFAGLVPNLHPGIFLAGFADGHVSAISYGIDEEVLEAMLTTDGGEAIDP